MIAFIDTSSLIKRYVREEGSDDLTEYMNQLTGAVVSPVTLIELYSGLTRRLNDRSLSLSGFQRIEEEMLRNFQHFNVVRWNDDLVIEAVAMVRRHKLRTLDAIQLASAKLAKAQQLLASDLSLTEAARKEIKKVIVI